MLGLYGAAFFVPLYGVMRLAAEWSGWTFPFESDRLFSALVVARGWSALLSTLTVWLVYRIGRRLSGPTVGLVAATLLAVCPLAVREAHSAKPDSAAMAATALWLLAALRPAPSPPWRALALGALTAFVVDLKLLLGIVPALGFTLFYESDESRSRWRSVALAFVAFCAATLLLRWYVLVHPREWAVFLPLLLDTTRPDRFPGAADVAGPLRYHTMVSLRFGCGLLAALLAPVALARGILGGRKLQLLAACAIGLSVPVMLSTVVLARYILPILPALFVLIAVVIVESTVRAPR